MSFSNYTKETSERSDKANWAKKQLVENTSYHFEGIEGCNENTQDVVTHLMERARVDYDGIDNASISDVYNAILNLETAPVLTRKINFANKLGLPLTYILYCNEKEKVWRYEFADFTNLRFIASYDSYKEFSEWIFSIKGWNSSKGYREKGLPYFDIALRDAGTAWPTNLDCFICDKDNHPVAILEFQNAKKTTVKDHCNNEYFLCKDTHFEDGRLKYDNDIRRWQSQEIIRLQSDLRLFVIVWQQDSTDYKLKEIEKITFPLLPHQKDWTTTEQYKAAMHNYANSRDRKDGLVIAQNFSSYSLKYSNNRMETEIHPPRLSAKKRTFPFIYYKYTELSSNDQKPIHVAFEQLLLGIKI